MFEICVSLMACRLTELKHCRCFCSDSLCLTGSSYQPYPVAFRESLKGNIVKVDLSLSVSHLILVFILVSRTSVVGFTDTHERGCSSFFGGFARQPVVERLGGPLQSSHTGFNAVCHLAWAETPGQRQVCLHVGGTWTDYGTSVNFHDNDHIKSIWSCKAEISEGSTF